MNGPFGGLPVIFTLVPLFIAAVFVLVFVSIIVRVGRGVAEWSSNNAQPEIGSTARVAAKRTEVSGTDDHTSTSYFATFELQSSERREFSVLGREYGMLAEGDAGILRYQGTRYLGFSREASAPNAFEPPAPADAGPNLVCAYCGDVNPPGTLKCSGCGSGKLAPAEPPVDAT